MNLRDSNELIIRGNRKVNKAELNLFKRNILMDILIYFEHIYELLKV